MPELGRCVLGRLRRRLAISRCRSGTPSRGGAICRGDDEAGPHWLARAARPRPPPLSSADTTPVWGLRLPALEQNSIISLFLCLFVHLNVYLEPHFVKNLPFLFPS